MDFHGEGNFGKIKISFERGFGGTPRSMDNVVCVTFTAYYKKVFNEN